MPFDGTTYERERDGGRLKGQLSRVIVVMRDGEWHTPSELERKTGDTWSSINARLRDLRKEKFGRHTVEREYVERGLFRYRLIVNPFSKRLS